MMEEDVRIALVGEDKSAAAFASAGRNAENLRQRLSRMHASAADQAKQAALSYDVMGFSLGRLAAGGALAAFGTQAYQAFTTLERTATRSTLGFRATEQQTRDITVAMKKLSEEIGDTSISTESLLKAVGKFGSDGTKSLDQVFALMRSIGQSSRAMNVTPESLATSFKAMQRHLKVTDEQAQQLFDHMAMRPISEETLSSVQKLSRVWAQSEGTGVESTKKMFDTINVLKKQYGSAEEAIGAIERTMTRMAGPEMQTKFRELGLAIDWRREMEEAKTAGRSQLETFTRLLDIAVKTRGERVLDDIFGARQRDTGRALLGLSEKQRAEHEKAQNSQGRVAQINETLNKNNQAALDRLAIAYKNLQEEFGKFVSGTKSVEFLTGAFNVMNGALEKTGRLIHEAGEAYEKGGLKGVQEFYKNTPGASGARNVPGSARQLEGGLGGGPRTGKQSDASKLEPGAIEKAWESLYGEPSPGAPRSDKGSRPQLEDNTKALKENTDQLRGGLSGPKKISYTPSGSGGGSGATFLPGPRGGGMWVPDGGDRSPPAPPSGPGGSPAPGAPPGAGSFGGPRSGGGGTPSFGEGGGAAGTPTRGDPRGMIPYIRETAKKYGIDPDVAVRVAQSEGLSNPVGDRGMSHGAFQLYKGGGLGNEFQKQTGLDAANPANERATIDYALQHASKKGWGAFHGAKNTGIGPWAGIGGRSGATEQPFIGGATSPGVRQSPSGTAPDAFIMHHTGGRGSPQSVVSDWQRNRPGIGTQYIMDRDGNIHDTKQLGYSGTGHMIRGSGAGAGLSNRNTVGMEMIAKNDRDVTPAQVEAAKAFMRKNYPNTPVLGHGQVNPGHREATEGKTIVDAINRDRARKGQQAAAPAWQRSSSYPEAAAGMGQGAAYPTVGEFRRKGEDEEKFMNYEKFKSNLNKYGMPEDKARSPTQWQGGNATDYEDLKGSMIPGKENPNLEQNWHDRMNDAKEMRAQMERPIKLAFDSKGGQFVRSSMRREADRELRESRWDSYSDIGAA